MRRQCFFKCLLDSHTPIDLPHNSVIIIGRSKQTKIKDQSCSRKQISLKADCEECQVEVKQLGVNASGLDGFALKKSETYYVPHGSKIDVVFNNHTHVIEFDPPPENHEKESKKRKLESKVPSKMEKPLDTEVSLPVALENEWQEVDHGQLYIFTSKGVKSSKKIAAFDMDGTLITTKSGKVFPVDTKDWKILFPSISSKLKQYFENEFKIVIMSNQGPIGSGRVKIEDFKKKVEAIIETLDVPIEGYFATGKGSYRKPMTGMWKTLKKKNNDSLPIDTTESFYCGDAAGRIANWAPGKKKDHSMVDKLLAENLGLKFYTPEQFFLGHSIANVPMSKPEFTPIDIKPEPFNEKLIVDQQEILVLVGFPGSGKSFIAKQIEKKSARRYVSVCRDDLGSWQKCATEAKTLLNQKKSVIIDCTNPDADSRKRWTSLAKEMNVICRCAKMTTSKAHSQHNNRFRELMKFKHVPVNDIIYFTYKNKYSEPKLDEGFKEIISVKFNPDFDSKAAENLYRMHLLEK